MTFEEASTEAAWEGPSDEDWAWYLEATYTDPMESHHE